MALSPNGKNVALNAIAAVADYVSLHTADPGTTGSSEVTGGSPAYARKPIAWNGASGGSIDDSTNGIEFDVPAGTTVTHVGLWSDAVGGTFYGGIDIDNESYTNQGTYVLEDVDLTAI